MPDTTSAAPPDWHPEEDDATPPEPELEEDREPIDDEAGSDEVTHVEGDTPGMAACGAVDGALVVPAGRASSTCNECLAAVDANIAADHDLPSAEDVLANLADSHDDLAAALDHRAGLEHLRSLAPTPGKRPAESWQGAPSSDPEGVADALEHLARLLRARVAPVPTGLQLSLFVSSLIPYDYAVDRVGARSEQEPGLARDLVRAMGGGKWAKVTTESTTYGVRDYLKLEGMLGVIPTTVYVTRDAVCERVVVGRQTVEHPATEEVVLPARPARTEVVEQVEWRCAPLLGAAAETGTDVTL